jgi:S1-C subfamily serine protease
MRRHRTTSLLSAALGGVAAALTLTLAHPFATSNHKTVVRSSGEAAFASSVTTTGALTPRAIYESDAHGVVAIKAGSGASQTRSPFPGQQEQRRTDTGSGIVIAANGLILTNEHVIDGAGSITVSLDGHSEHTRAATVVGADRSKDLALLRIDPAGATLHPLKLASSSSSAEVGDPAYAIGNPFGLNWTLTTGIVSALNRQIRAPDGTAITHVIQTDAALNPGNSGGPLLDSSGSVIGVNSQIVSGSSTAGSQGGSVGLGFAISAPTVRAFLGELKVVV